MGFVTGLKEISELVEKANEARGERVKTRWLRLSDGQAVKVRFVNELDESSPNYNPSRGLALVTYEHTDPKDYKNKFVCSMDTEGRCYGCEQNAAGVKGWYRKMRFYINLLVDDGVQEPYVATWSMSVARNSTLDIIFEYFKETGSITNLTWRLRRNGVKTDTTYALIPTSPDPAPFDWSTVVVPDLEQVPFQVPYDRQAERSKPAEAHDATAESALSW